MSILGIISVMFSSDFMNIVEKIFCKQPVNYNIGVSVGMIMSIFIIIMVSVFIVDRITKTALKEKRDTNKFKKATVGGVMGAALMSLFILIWKLGSKVLFEINIFWAIAIIVGFFITHKVLSRI